jgi:hypothetical protein
MCAKSLTCLKSKNGVPIIFFGPVGCSPRGDGTLRYGVYYHVRRASYRGLDYRLVGSDDNSLSRFSGVGGVDDQLHQVPATFSEQRFLTVIIVIIGS